MKMHVDKTSRYTLLDILRGIAAFSVVMWHWKHFYFSNISGTIELPNKVDQPFYSALFPLYNFGGIAVDLFFLISGFIFYTLYSKKIRQGSISGTSFFILRFSRLYPLHAITLVAVGLLQYLYFNHTQHFFIYTHNDVYHFILHLFFASSWGLEHGDSFNGPVWSVSIEIILYALFFLMCKFKLNGPAWTVLTVIVALFLPTKYELIARGLLSFFMGGLCYHLLNRLERAKRQDIYPPAFILLFSASILLLATSPIFTAIADGLSRVVHSDATSPLLSLVKTSYAKLVIFPLLLMSLATAERRFSRYFSFLTWIGDITYSSYLLHFPLQLVFILTGFYLGLQWDFYSTTTFLVFVGILVAISLLSYYKLELPLQNIIRKQQKNTSQSKSAVLR